MTTSKDYLATTITTKVKKTMRKTQKQRKSTKKIQSMKRPQNIRKRYLPTSTNKSLSCGVDFRSLFPFKTIKRAMALELKVRLFSYY